ncbi:MAG: PhnD/SsuA/transferrin family substrate-binding protein [Gemmatimonadaceae bacterium]|nr:PhnD/SsuA/transferrin family substrate-binding protein [Acetobacteraceae bacterium]
MSNRPARRLFIAGALAFAIAGSPMAALAQAAPPAGELRMAVTDIVGLENLQREWGAFQRVLQQRTGLSIRFYPVPNRTAAVEALSAKRVDMVLTGPAEYVVFKVRTDAVPVVGLTRLDYFANIVVRADSTYNILADLRGQRIGLGSIGSTSRHLGPLQVLADQGIDPKTDLRTVHLATSVLLESLVRGDIAAAGINNTDLARLRERNPGVVFRVIGRGRDLPIDLILAGSHVEPAMVERMRDAFRRHGPELTAAILEAGGENLKFSGMQWVPTIRDEDYNYVRRMYGTIGQPQFAAFVGD